TTSTRSHEPTGTSVQEASSGDIRQACDRVAGPDECSEGWRALLRARIRRRLRARHVPRAVGGARFGERMAELMEAPVMLAVTIIAAGWVVRRLALPTAVLQRLGMGGFVVGRWGLGGPRVVGRVGGLRAIL